MIQDKLLKLFVDKGMDCELKYNYSSDRYMIIKTIDKRYILFYSCIDGYYDSYINLYINNNEVADDTKTALAIYLFNLYLLCRIFI